MKITKTQLRSIIKEAVSVERLKALEGRPHKIDINKIAAPNELRSYFRDAYAEGEKTAFNSSESPDSDPDEPYWSVYGPYEVLIADEMGQKEAEAVSDALNAEYREYLETQDMGDFGFARQDYPTAWHNT